MFLRYRIMKRLTADKAIAFEDLMNDLNISNKIKFVTALSSLKNDGFICVKNYSVSLSTFSSYREYRLMISRKIFDISVSISAIVVAVTSVIQLSLQLSS